MLTMFAMPKPFRGHIGVIQRNAIASWTRLRPKPDIVLFGDEEGTAAAACEFGAVHVSDVSVNGFGTPLIGPLFASAEQMSMRRLLCYVNADIILMSDFCAAVERVGRMGRRFLMVGRRWDVEIREPWAFSANWESGLRSQVAASGTLHAATGIDYFVFSRSLLGRVPDFAIGRGCWDNWLLWRAADRGGIVVDATHDVTAVHQNHDYGHLRSAAVFFEGPEAKRNRELAGGRIWTLDDADRLLANGCISQSYRAQRLKRLWGGCLRNCALLAEWAAPIRAARRLLRQRSFEI